jgi:adenosylmethionine-8-amino-7-oxononanoate aminotransferase
MTSDSRPLGAAHYPFVPGAVPLVVTASEGNYLITQDGRRILDAAGGAIVTNIGHGRPEIAEVAAAATSSVDYVVPPWATPARIALRDRLVSNWLPEGLDQVGFCSGGSEAADSAIRLAIAHHVCSGRPERRRVIGRWPSYHGVTLASLSAGGHLGRRNGYDGVLLDFPHVPWDDPEALEAMIIAQGPSTIAAFIAEPIIGAAGGVLAPPEGYFAEVAEICRRYGVLFIVDEVMSGFGRAGRNLAIEHWDVAPDIVYGGKGLGGGYAAVAGVYARAEVVAPLASAGHTFMFFTFGAQSAHCAVADRVLQVLEDENLVERSAKLGTVLTARLEEALGDHPPGSAVRGGLGLWAGIELVAEREPHTWYPEGTAFAAKVSAHALTRVVWGFPSGSGDPVRVAIRLGPPFTNTEDEIDRIVGTLRSSLYAAAAQASG